MRPLKRKKSGWKRDEGAKSCSSRSGIKMAWPWARFEFELFKVGTK